MRIEPTNLRLQRKTHAIHANSLLDAKGDEMASQSGEERQINQQLTALIGINGIPVFDRSPMDSDEFDESDLSRHA